MNLLCNSNLVKILELEFTITKYRKIFTIANNYYLHCYLVLMVWFLNFRGIEVYGVFDPECLF